MTTKKIILLGTVCVSIVYLLFVFANMNFNPKMWAASAAAVCAFLMGTVILLAVGGVIINESSKDISYGNKEIFD